MAMKTIDELKKRCSNEELAEIFRKIIQKEEVFHGPFGFYDKCYDFLVDFWTGVPLRANRTHYYNVCNKHYKLVYWAWFSGHFYIKCQRPLFKMISSRIGYAIDHPRPATLKKYIMARGPEHYYPIDYVGLMFSFASGKQSAVYMNTTELDCVDIKIGQFIHRLQAAGFVAPFKEGYMRLFRPYKAQLLTFLRGLVTVPRLEAVNSAVKSLGWDAIRSMWNKALKGHVLPMEEAIVLGFVAYQVTRTLRFGSVLAMEDVFDDEERKKLYLSILENVMALKEMHEIQKERHYSRLRLFEKQPFERTIVRPTEEDEKNEKTESAVL